MQADEKPVEAWEALAESVSLASAISPALLREARVCLHPHLGPDAEGMVWMSSYVERRTSSFCWFRPASGRELRRRLVERKGVEQAWLHLQSVLEEESPLSFLEAKLYYLTATGRGRTPEAVTLLRRALVSAAQNPGIAPWALRTLASIDAVTDVPEGWALKLVAHTLLNRRDQDSDRPPSGVFDLPWEDILPRDLPTTPIGVRAEAGFLRFTAVPDDGFTPLIIPKSEPLLVFVEYEEWSSHEGGYIARRHGVTIPSTGVCSVEVPPGKVRVLTLDRREYTLGPRRSASVSQTSRVELEEYMWGGVKLLQTAGFHDEIYRSCVAELVFYKRICDLWEEAGRPAGEGSDSSTEYPEVWAKVPHAHSWSNVRSKFENTGRALCEAFRAIERANPTFRGLFGAVEGALDAGMPEHYIRRLLEYFEEISLQREYVAPWTLGGAFETLLARLADAGGKRGGESYTSKPLAKLMVKLLEPRSGEAAYDPVCGAGGLLLEVVRRAEREGVRHRPMLFGQEKDPRLCAYARMSLLLHEVSGVVEQGDSLMSPQYLERNDELKQFDMALGSPPFGLHKWLRSNKHRLDDDRYGRARYGVPLHSSGDLAFLQHMIASLSPRGRVAVICPYGVLFREGGEARIREGIVKDDLVDAVIGLGSSHFGTAVPLVLFLLKKGREQDRRGKVLFVNGEEETAARNAREVLSERHVDRLVQAVKRFEDEDRFCRVVGVEDIAHHEWNLSINLYVQTAALSENLDLRHETKELRRLLKHRDHAKARLNSLLGELGYSKA
jgi:type I restriction enzyme M protein